MEFFRKLISKFNGYKWLRCAVCNKGFSGADVGTKYPKDSKTWLYTCGNNKCVAEGNKRHHVYEQNAVRLTWSGYPKLSNRVIKDAEGVSRPDFYRPVQVPGHAIVSFQAWNKQLECWHVVYTWAELPPLSDYKDTRTV